MGNHLENHLGFPCGSDIKESACNVEDPGSVPEVGRAPGKGNGNSPQYSCLEISTDRGAWQATVYGVSELETTARLHFLSFFWENTPGQHQYS